MSSQQQAIAIALSENGISTILKGILPSLANQPISVDFNYTENSPAGSALEPEVLKIYGANISNLSASLVSVTPPSSSSVPTYAIATKIGFHVTTTWEESGSTGG